MVFAREWQPRVVAESGTQDVQKVVRKSVYLMKVVINSRIDNKIEEKGAAFVAPFFMY